MVNTIFSLILSASMQFSAGSERSAAQFVQLPGELTEVTLYYPNGAIMQHGFMSEGQKTGEWITYDLQGNTTAKAYYREGEKTGKWKVYDADGNLEFKICYKNGKKQWAQQYDDQGDLTAFSYK